MLFFQGNGLIARKTRFFISFTSLIKIKRIKHFQAFSRYIYLSIGVKKIAALNTKFQQPSMIFFKLKRIFFYRIYMYVDRKP